MGGYCKQVGKVVSLECIVCATPFQHVVPGRGRYPRFCSEICRTYQYGRNFRKSHKKRLSGEPMRIRRVEAQEFVCTHCTQSYSGKPGGRPGNKFCSTKCHDEWWAAFKRAEVIAKCQPRPCKSCGTEFTPHQPGMNCCSVRCNRMMHWSDKNHKRRAQTEGQFVNKLAVFDRDGWRCQLCGIRTPKRLKGTTKPNAPELDHILPLALGGDHSYSNVHLACRRCNGSKGAKAMGQMMLFAEPLDAGITR